MRTWAETYHLPAVLDELHMSGEATALPALSPRGPTEAHRFAVSNKLLKPEGSAFPVPHHTCCPVFSGGTDVS